MFQFTDLPAWRQPITKSDAPRPRPVLYTAAMGSQGFANCASGAMNGVLYRGTRPDPMTEGAEERQLLSLYGIRLRCPDTGESVSNLPVDNITRSANLGGVAGLLPLCQPASDTSPPGVDGRLLDLQDCIQAARDGWIAGTAAAANNVHYNSSPTNVAPPQPIMDGIDNVSTPVVTPLVCSCKVKPRLRDVLRRRANNKINCMAVNGVLGQIEGRKTSKSLQRKADIESSFSWITPSGERKVGEGVDDPSQGVISVEQLPEGGIVLRVTLLVAGFIIGPSGKVVRRIIEESGAVISSLTEFQHNRRRRLARAFFIEGSSEAVGKAFVIILHAVVRYKQLLEGTYTGKLVDRSQHIDGVEFFYQPPPKYAVPHAAAI